MGGSAPRAGCTVVVSASDDSYVEHLAWSQLDLDTHLRNIAEHWTTTHGAPAGSMEFDVATPSGKFLFRPAPLTLTVEQVGGTPLGEIHLIAVPVGEYGSNP